MKLLFIDDNKEFPEKIYKSLTDEELNDGNKKYFLISCNSPLEISQNFYDLYINKDDEQSQESSTISINIEGDNELSENPSIIFLNIEGKYGGIRQDQKGVEILMWLRCKHKICNPIILYSYQSNQQLLKQKPEHLVINSMGCYYYHLPFDFREIKNREFKGLEEKDWLGLKKYLKPAFNIEEFRHIEANWWGVKALWDVHRFANNDFDDDYPQTIKVKLELKDNMIAEFLYSFDVFKFIDYVKKSKKEIESNLDEVSNDMEYDKFRIELLKEKLEKTNNEIDSLNNKISEYNSYKNSTSNTDPQYTGIIQELSIDNDLIESYNSDKAEGESEINKLNETLVILKQEWNKTISNIENVIISTKNELIPKIPNVSKCNILYIDDKINEGWSEILCHIVKECSVTPFCPDQNTKNVEDVYENNENGVKKIITDNQPDLILLDLRLFNEDTKSINIEEISGFKLLEKIRLDFKGIPIIVTTASNKVWSYTQILKAGADGYWIKEGIDDKRDFQDSINNYLLIIKMIKIFNNDVYKSLTKIGELLSYINENNLWWSEEITWLDNSKSQGDKKQIASLIEEIIISYRNYFCNFYNNSNFVDANEEHSFFSSSIINKLSCIIENIHGIQDEETWLNIHPDIIMVRGDIRYAKIKEYRNLSSHNTYKSKITIDSLIITIDLIYKYLTINPQWEETTIGHDCLYENKKVKTEFSLNGKRVKYINKIDDASKILREIAKKNNLKYKKPSDAEIAISELDYYPVLFCLEDSEVILFEDSIEVMLNKDIIINKNYLLFDNQIYKIANSLKQKISVLENYEEIIIIKYNGLVWELVIN